MHTAPLPLMAALAAELLLLTEKVTNYYYVNTVYSTINSTFSSESKHCYYSAIQSASYSAICSVI
jgi:hypothetical protein